MGIYSIGIIWLRAFSVLWEHIIIIETTYGLYCLILYEQPVSPCSRRRGPLVKAWAITHCTV